MVPAGLITALEVRKPPSTVEEIGSLKKFDPLQDKLEELTAVRNFSGFLQLAVMPALSTCSFLFCLIHHVPFGNRYFRFLCKIPALTSSAWPSGHTVQHQILASLSTKQKTRGSCYPGSAYITPESGVISQHPSPLGKRGARTRIEPCNHGVSPSLEPVVLRG